MTTLDVTESSPIESETLELIQLARDILEAGTDRGCTKIKITIGSVSVEAEFMPPEPQMPAIEAKPEFKVPKLTPDNVLFPGEVPKY